MSTQTLEAPPAEATAAATYTSPVEWTGDKTLAGVDARSKYGPALVETGGKIVMTYRGDSTTNLYQATYDGKSWSGDDQIQVSGETLQANGRPALLAHDETLLMAYQAAGSTQLRLARFNGSIWAEDTAIVGPDGQPIQSDRTPALALFDGKVQMVYKTAGHSALRLATFDGFDWTTDQAIADMPGGVEPRSDSGPAVAVVGPFLVLIFVGHDNANLYQAAYDGKAWRSSGKIPNGPKSSKTPAVVVFDDALYVLYRGNKNADLYQDVHLATMWDGNRAISSFSDITPRSAQTPGAAVLGNEIVMVYRGDSKTDLYQMTATPTA